MNGFKEWWDQNSARDQLALAVLGFFALLIILYFGILKPIQTKSEVQERNNLSARSSLKNVREMANVLLNKDSKSTQQAAASIVELVDTSLRAHNLRLAGMQPSGSNDVRLRLDDIRFDNLLAWLNEMEANHGLQIKEMSVVAGEEPGRVSVNTRLHQD